MWGRHLSARQAALAPGRLFFRYILNLTLDGMDIKMVEKKSMEFSQHTILLSWDHLKSMNLEKIQALLESAATTMKSMVQIRQTLFRRSTSCCCFVSSLHAMFWPGASSQSSIAANSSTPMTYITYPNIFTRFVYDCI